MLISGPERTIQSPYVLRLVLHNPESPDTHRVPQWKMLLRNVPESPILGHGLGNYPRCDDPVLLGLLRVRGHSTYLASMYELGFVGFLLFVIGYMLALRRAWEQTVSPEEPSWIVLWTLTAWSIVMLTSSVFIGSGYFTSPLTWFYIGWLGSRATRKTGVWSKIANDSVKNRFGVAWDFHQP